MKANEKRKKAKGRKEGREGQLEKENKKRRVRVGERGEGRKKMRT